MAEYINIKGINVEAVASDPANPTVGQIWYNSTSNTLKGSVYVAASWATGGTLNTGGYNSAGFGTQTDAVMAGRTPLSTAVEEYNGSTWTTVTSYPSPTVSGNRGFGVQTAGVSVGGEGGAPIVIRSDTQNYDGSTWTSGGSYPTAVEVQYSCGTATAGLCASGYPNVNQANEYNGSTWSTGGTPASSGRNNGATGGIQTAAYMAGGSPVASFGSVTEEYDGTSWSSGGTLATPTAANSGFGTLTNGVTVGGENPVSGALNTTQIYNGTTWSTSTNLTRTVTNYAVSGQNSPGSAGIIYGGPTPTNTQTNEWTGAGPQTQTITAS
jgi:hypothetical protein